ncbi:BTB/POZ domain containing protein [Balamuthia mandrillaris]
MAGIPFVFDLSAFSGGSAQQQQVQQQEASSSSSQQPERDLPETAAPPNTAISTAAVLNEMVPSASRAFTLPPLLSPEAYYTQSLNEARKQAVAAARLKGVEEAAAPTALKHKLRQNRTLLHYAVETSSLQDVKAALEEDPTLLEFSFVGRGTPLHVAARLPDHHILEYLLTNELNPVKAWQLTNLDALHGKSPLIIAAGGGNLASVRLLLNKAEELGCLILVLGQFDNNGFGPLQAAVCSSNVECVKALLERGAATAQRFGGEETDDTPLHLAAFFGYEDIVQLLVSDKQLRTSWASSVGETPLHKAASRGHTEIARILLQNDAEINAKDAMGCTPLHRACSFGHIDMAGLLLEQGADVNSRNNVGITPFFKAREDLKIRWKRRHTRGDAPCRRSGHTATKVGTKLYVFGGYDGKTYCNDLHVFDTDSSVWYRPECKGDAPAPRTMHSAVLHDHHIFFFGGCDNTSHFSDLFLLDTVTFTWAKPKVHGSQPSKRSGHSATRFGHQIFFIGGYESSSYFDDIYILNCETLTWSKASITGDQFPARAWHSATQVRSKLYVFGGCGEHMLNQLYVLDPGPTVHCTLLQTRGDEVSPCSGHAATLVGSQLYYVAGGMFDSFIDNIRILDVDTSTWRCQEGQRNLGKQMQRDSLCSPSLNLIGTKLFCCFEGKNKEPELCVNTFETGKRNSLQSDLRSALLSGEFTDLTLCFPNEENKQIQCHKVMLAARSARFRQLLEKYLGGSSGDSSSTLLEITDMKYDVAVDLVEICYSDMLAQCPPHATELFRTVKDYISTAFRPALSSLMQNTKVASNLGHDLKEGALGSSQFSDVEFVVEGVIVPGHKVIIAARCPHFQAMFMGGMKESREKQIEVPSIPHSIFMLVMEFLYTDAVECLPALSPNDTIELLSVANLYTLDYLKQLCEERLLAFINAENVWLLFQAALLYHAEKLRSVCWKYLEANPQLIHDLLAFAESSASNNDGMTLEETEEEEDTPSNIQKLSDDVWQELVQVCTQWKRSLHHQTKE